MRHHIGVRRLGSPDADPHVAGGAPVHQPREHGRSSPSSARVFQTSGEGPWRSGGCLNHITYAGCWQAAPVTIQGLKCTPRALPLARITSGATDEGRSVDTPDRGLHGRGVGQGCPHERLEVPPRVVLPKGSHVEATHVGICQNRRV